MIEEEYVSFDTAKLLKEKGFMGIPCTRFYAPDSKTFFNGYSSNGREEGYAAPTQELAMRWLRNEHKTHIVVNPNPTNPLFYLNIYKLYGDEWVPADCDTSMVYSGESIEEKNFKTYEEAAEAAIKYCLEKL